ncbi:MAG: SAM-dependent DNA methyltransferase [Treponema sp.]|uniref:type I restriction-modification system subunit M n=1 Tax=Treponema sp. TaxID=166 RepID=UPI0025DE82FB|nr:class I SAM-dependent DNA methyltransferase [Treponema sp.]MBQ8678783.1 SAM-dependent DNA methyltransferase [Treponema sp.]
MAKKTNRIPLDELEKYLWHSAVLLRTKIDAGAYKQYIFPLLFFKRLSDVYDEETQKALEETDGDTELACLPEYHNFMIPEGFHWNDVRTKSENIGKALVEAFKAIENANSEKLEGIFGDAAWTNKNRLPDRLLKDLIEHFSSKTLSLENCPEDELGQGYEYLIKQFADDSGHTAQEFYTNRTVVHLMTEILKPQSGESIYDPTCGSAGMLISSIAYLQQNKKEWRNVKLYGQEINALSASIGKMNLFLHGIKDFEIINDDTLKSPGFLENNKLKTFNLVVANPPYSISQWDRDTFAADRYGRNFLGVPSQGIADFAFLQHILCSMDKDNGRSASLLPRGILSRYAEIDMRKKLITTDLVECVIAVGKGLFYNSPMEACVLICKTNKNLERKNKVLFINASEMIEKKGTQTYISDQQIKIISDIYNNFSEKTEISKVITNDEILKNEGSMNISLYVPLLKNSEKSDMYKNAIPQWESASLKMNETIYSFSKLLEN